MRGEVPAAVERSLIDIVVSDIAMPGEDGYQLIEKIRAMNFDSDGPIPVVAITAYAKEEDRQKALSAGLSKLPGQAYRVVRTGKGRGEWGTQRLKE